MRGNDRGMRPEAQEATEALSAWLQQRVAVITPPDCDEHEDCLEDPTGELLLTEWTLVTAWTDEDGRTWVSVLDSPNLPLHHRTGLLRHGLDM